MINQSLINCQTHLYNTLILHILSTYSLAIASHFMIVFSIKKDN